MQIGKSRLLSLGVALLVVILSLISPKPVLLPVVVLCVACLAFIWFSDAIGSYTGMISRVPITKETPGCFVAIVGWIVLLALLAAVVLEIAGGKKPQ